VRGGNGPTLRSPSVSDMATCSGTGVRQVRDGFDPSTFWECELGEDCQAPGGASAHENIIPCTIATSGRCDYCGQ
jgi:hypothetical protein